MQEPEHPVVAQPSRRERAARLLGLVRLALIGLVGLYALLFVVLNTRHVKVDFVFVSTRVSLIWVILLSLAAGFVLAVLAGGLRRYRQRRG
jgi:uncharacterized integral membrane protein